jgi:hypothetical protein
MGPPEPGPEKQPVTLAQVLESASSQATHKPDSVSKLRQRRLQPPSCSRHRLDPHQQGRLVQGLLLTPLSLRAAPPELL